MTVIGLWWAWLVLAVILAALEVLLPVFVFLGFAAGATVTGIALALGLGTGAGWTLMIFAVLSALAYLGLRMALGRDGGRARIVRGDINDN